MSTINVDNYGDGTSSVPASAVLEGTAKAWVNFDGTGTISERNGYNVSSLTDSGSGRYDVNFTNNFDSANYSRSGAGGTTGSAIFFDTVGYSNQSSSSFETLFRDDSAINTDVDDANAQSHGNLA